MVISGDINESDNRETKGSARERGSTQQQNMNMNEGILCPLCSLCCVINLQILLPSISGCYPFLQQREGDSCLDAFHIICLTFCYWAPIFCSFLLFTLTYSPLLHFTSLLFNDNQNTGQLYVTHNTAQFHSCHPQKNWKGKHDLKLTYYKLGANSHHCGKHCRCFQRLKMPFVW